MFYSKECITKPSLDKVFYNTAVGTVDDRGGGYNKLWGGVGMVLESVTTRGCCRQMISKVLTMLLTETASSTFS